MIVLDASFVAKILLEEDGSGEARRLLRDWLEAGEELATVEHMFAEVLNVLWKHAVKIRDLGVEDALAAARDLERLRRLLEVYPVEGYATEALRLAAETGLTAYDALHLALAGSRGAVLATFDKRLARRAAEIGVRAVPG